MYFVRLGSLFLFRPKFESSSHRERPLERCPLRLLPKISLGNRVTVQQEAIITERRGQPGGLGSTLVLSLVLVRVPVSLRSIRVCIIARICSSTSVI
jgi:hypothetical protein